MFTSTTAISRVREHQLDASLRRATRGRSRSDTRQRIQFLPSSPPPVDVFRRHEPAVHPSCLGATGLRTLRLRPHFKHREERFLRNLDAADALHPLLPFLLLLEQLSLAADVAAVALRE